MAKETFSFEEAAAPANVFTFEEALGTPTVDRGPALESDPLTRVSPSTPGAQPTFTAGPTAAGEYERPGFAAGFTKGIIESQRPLGPGGVLLRAADALTGGYAQERYNKANRSVLDDKTDPALAGEFAKPAPAKPRAPVLQPRTDTISPTGGVVDALADVPVNTARALGSTVLNFGALAAELGLTLQSPEQFRAGAAKLDKAKARTGLGVSDEPLARTGTALDALIPSAKTLADYAPEGIKQLGMMAVMGPGAIVADAGARGVNQAREDGLGLASSVLFGAGKAASEGVPEAFSAKFAVEAAKRIPLAQALRGDTQAVTTAFRQTAQSMGVELGSEQVSALGNWVVDKIAADPTATPDRLVADMKEAVKATIVQGPTMLAGAKLMQTAATGLAQRPEDRAAREIARAIDQTDLPSTSVPTLNPNLAAAQVLEAPSIDAAIRVAEQVVATPAASAAVDNIARLIGQPASPVAITQPEATNVSATPEIPTVAAGNTGSRAPEPAPVLDAGVGNTAVAGTAMDAGGVRVEPASDAAPLGASTEIPAAVAPGIVAQARTPAVMPVSQEPQAAAPTASWVIREKGTGKVIQKTFSQEVVEKLNTAKYEAMPIQQHLAQMNRLIKEYGEEAVNRWARGEGLPTNPQNVNTSAQPAQKPREIEQVGPFGRDLTPIAQGGKPFKTKAEADAFRKANTNNMRTVKQGTGFVLRELTPKELAAREKAAKRIAQPRAGQSGVPISAHAFIADKGGLARDAMADAGFDRNMKVGNRWLFAGADKPGMTLAQAAELLAEAGYIREESETAAADIIKRSMRSPQYTAEGWERIAEAEQETRFEDHLAAQQEAATEEDPFPLPSDYLKQDAELAGLNAKSVTDEERAEVAALVAQAEAMGLEGEIFLEDAARVTDNDQDYYERAKQSLQDAIAQSGGSRRNESAGGNDQAGRGQEAKPEGGDDRGQSAGEQGAARSQDEGLTPDIIQGQEQGQPAPVVREPLSNQEQKDNEPALTAPTESDILAQQQRRENADELDQRAQIDREAERQTLTAQTAPEQRRDNTGDMFGGPSVEDVQRARKPGKQQEDDGTAPLFARARISEADRAENLKRWSNNAPYVSSEAADTYDFKTGQKVMVEAYHGTARPDRVGTVFQRKRATSGPMAFFTSAPELASSYAQGKQDTSITDDERIYAQWFKYKPAGQRSAVDIVRAWNFLPEETKARIAALAPRIKTDDATGEQIELGPEGTTNGIGNYEWELEQTQRSFDRRGNPLKALMEGWLNGGVLFNEEERFLQVLEMAGFPVKDVTYDAPNATYPFVYKTYIAMQKPLVTGDVPQAVIDALKEAAKRDRSRAQIGGTDMWDKNTRTLREWVANYTDPANDSASYVWTSIPDKVTDVLKSMGYDGIIDWSGKGGGDRHPVYIPFEETQVKSAIGNKGTFDPLKKDILFARAWRSDLRDKLAEAKMESSKEEGWRAFIQGLTTKGVKPDEIEWSGVTDWLKLQTGKVTKQQVLAYLDGNGVQVQEVVLGDRLAETLPEGWEVAPNEDGDGFILVDEDGEVRGEGETEREAIESAQDEDARAETPGATKYSQYTLPGGTNYREVLLTLPTPADDRMPAAKKIGDAMARLREEAAPGVDYMRTPEYQALQKQMRALNDAPDPRANAYQSSHWGGTLNVLAHIRVDDRVDADGNRVLMVQELQSDWGQEGKKRGFTDPAKPIAVIDKKTGAVVGRFTDEVEAARDVIARGEDRFDWKDTQGTVPVAPFVTATDKWLSLALKRIITMAAQEGYDKVAFVNGEQSAERYDLSKQIKEFRYEPIPGSDLFEIGAVDTKDDVVFEEDNVTISRIEELVGKEIAQKVANREGKKDKDTYRDWHYLRGLDLKVGGEGMKAFYNTIVPNTLKTVLKKVGGGALETVELQIPGQKAGATDSNTGAVIGPNGTAGKNLDATGFTITPEMRQKASQGLPLFRRGNAATGLTLADAQRAVDALKAAGLRKLVLAETIEQLPESGMRKIKSENATGVRGMYDPVTDTAYLVRQNLTSIDDALFVGLHEAFHRGLRKTFGPKVEPVLNMIHNGNARVQRQTVAYMQKFKIGRMEAIEEVLADMAGQGETGDLNGWDKLLAFLRDALGKIAKAMGVTVTFTDEQITDLVAGIRRAGMQDEVFIETAAPQTDTKAFKEWFGDSKVVGAEGRPLVVYHSSTFGDFSTFDKAKQHKGMAGYGFYFSDADGANIYADYGANFQADKDWQGNEKKLNIMPVYLAIQNPLVADNIAEVRARFGKADPGNFGQGRKYGGMSETAQTAIQRAGYDGVIANEYVARQKDGSYKVVEPSAKGAIKHPVYVAFEPSQIKSATGNRGTFDPADPDIRFSRTNTAQTKDNADPVRAELSPWRDATGRLQFAPGAWLAAKYGDTGKGAIAGAVTGAMTAGPVGAVVGAAVGAGIGAKLSQLQLKAPTPELRRIMRQMKLDVAKAQEVAAAVAGEATKLTDDERAMVSDLIEKELKAGTVPPEHAVRLAALINASMESQTDELVRLGMLTKDSADKWRGQYLPRYYESKLTEKAGDAWADAVRKLGRKPSAMKGIRGKHLKGRGLYETIPESQLAQWESLGWEVRDPDYTPGLPTMDGTVQVWRDFTRQERDKMGEIRDAGFRFVMGYMETQKDIALGRMFEQLATDPEMSSRLETEKFSVRVPDGKAPGTETKTYGKLAGRWVSPETLSQLSLIEESQSEALMMYRKAMGAWKEMKTVLNPVSHVNNTVSNMSMAHFAGVSYGRADKYLAAMRDFAKKSPMILEAKDNGLFLGTLSEAELMNTLPEELKVLAQKQEGMGQKIARSTFDLMSFYLRRPMGWAYQAEDTFFRYLIYKDARERGMEPQDAVDYAQRYIFTYDDLPKNARRIRDFGIPFFAYTYKAVPALLHTALTHPERLAAPAAVLWTINAAAYAIAAGDDEDDWDTRLRRYLTDPEYREKARQKEKLERELLPEWNKGTTSLGTPKVVRLGNDELTKLPLFIDISRIIPGGDLFDVNPNAGGIPLPQPITPSHPLFTTAVAMLANKDTFFGKELTDNNDTSGEKFEKRAAWLWKQFSPAIAVNNYHWQKGMNALAQAMGGEVKYVPDFLGGDATGIGRDGLPVQPKLAAMQTFGIKVRPYDFEAAEQIQEGVKNKMIRDIDTELRKLKRLENKGAVAERTVEKQRELANTKKERLRDGKTVDGEER